MKKRDLEAQLRQLGWWFHRQGKHEIWTNGSKIVALPRHSEVDERTAREILETARNYPPEARK